MNAVEARRKSRVNAPIVQAREEAFQRKEANRKRQEEEEKHNNFYNKLKKDVYQEIEWAVRDGKTSTQYFIKHYFYSVDECLAKYEYKNELKRILNNLKEKGFRAALNKVNTYHDTTWEYLNSGGECGSSKPYSTDDIVIKISW